MVKATPETAATPGGSVQRVGGGVPVVHPAPPIRQEGEERVEQEGDEDVPRCDQSRSARYVDESTDDLGFGRPGLGRGLLDEAHTIGRDATVVPYAPPSRLCSDRGAGAMTCDNHKRASVLVVSPERDTE